MHRSIKSFHPGDSALDVPSPSQAEVDLPLSESGLAARLCQGDAAAAREVVETFGRPLIALASRNLDALTRARVDPEEVVQSALGSFFRVLGHGELEPGGWAELWALLVVITRRKCRHQRRYWRADRRRIDRVDCGDPDAIASLVPGPVEVACLTELVEGLLASLPPPERSIVELSLEGLETREIAHRLGRSERTVQRVRQAVRDGLRRRMEIEPS